MASQDAAAADGSSAQPTKTTPKDALVMASILKEMGVTEFEPRVINQMVEFAYRYVTDTVEDARVYSFHANRKNMNIDDIKLAVSQKLDHSFTSPPPREFLLDIARSKNSLPLPLIADKSGIRLPPERYCLTANNFKVKSTVKKATQQRKQSMGSATGAQGKSSAKISSVPSNITAQKMMTHHQQPATQGGATQPASQQPRQAIPNQSSFPSMLKRKHQGDDDYDT